jgi:hypothetical protein
MKTFQRPPGHSKCRASSTIMDTLSFGTGELDEHGFWEKPCAGCARAHEQQFPEDGECWPHSPETLKKWAEEDAAYTAAKNKG